MAQKPHILLFCSIAVVALSLAGCTAEPPSTVDPGTEPPKVTATDTTGGIRGVVVDATITPIKDATVSLLETNDAVSTDASGGFAISGLAEGTYTVIATHVLYDTVQQTTVVKAGIDNPPALKMQLTRQIHAQPYMDTEHLQGYISCSINVIIFLSEECGEGLGSPETTCSFPRALGAPCPDEADVPNPVLPGERIGKAQNNRAQLDFNVDGPAIASLVAEAVWEPSLSVGNTGSQSGGFNMGIYKDFICDPFCRWDVSIDRQNGNSPLYLRNDDKLADLAASQNITSETQFSTFTWAHSEETGALLEQEFEVFVSKSYYLRLPEGWSFVNNDPDPFS